jgi:hypothetical protein
MNACDAINGSVSGVPMPAELSDGELLTATRRLVGRSNLAEVEARGLHRKRAGRIVPAAPTWSQFAESLCPVRELTAGDRPREWADSTELTQNVGELDESVAVPEAAPELPRRS